MLTGDSDNDDRLSATLSALANSTRRAILARLADGEAGVKELAEPFDMSLPAVSRHVKVLEQAGLITRARRGQYRPCALDASALAEVVGWADQYRHLWEGRLDRLEGHLQHHRASAEGQTV